MEKLYRYNYCHEIGIKLYHKMNCDVSKKQKERNKDRMRHFEHVFGKLYENKIG